MRKSPLLAVMLLLSVLTGGCGLGLQPERVVRGQEIDVETFASKLRPGMTSAEIERELGLPFQRKAARDGEEWRYLEVRTLRVCRPYLLFIPLGPAPKRRTDIRLELGQGGLRAAWVEIDPGEDGKRVRRPLLPT